MLIGELHLIVLSGGSGLLKTNKYQQMKLNFSHQQSIKFLIQRFLAIKLLKK